MGHIKDDFPALLQRVNGRPLVYLDSAATAMRPDSVLSAIDGFYRLDAANPHRGLYEMAVRATAAYDGARELVADFVGVTPEETIFVRNTSEALNLVAYCYGQDAVSSGDNIVITIAEHHSNLVPWQRIAQKNGAELRYLYIDRATGEIPDAEIERKIDSRTKIVAFTHVSNVLGCVFPVAKLVASAKRHGAVTVLDAAQSVPHMPVNFNELGVDFAAFSAHKMYGPMGIGALYGRRELLERMPPFLSGGDMIDDVFEQETIYAPLPHKFEAGTQNGGGAVGFAAAVSYVRSIGWERIRENEKRVMAKLIRELSALPYIQITGSRDERAERVGVVSFSIDDVHPHDAASVLDEFGVAVRAGKHCAHPLMIFLDVPFRATCRASLGIYTTEGDIDAFIDALRRVRGKLGYGD
ncbi:MAG: SufS family cysteine desulfurase [Oscillospiraceae bacterium]|jgi:cysteine desulfurase/selenocysteine lyase|nr:SufS family cysteine desulfurase [Oscillospiraceae bacterium]